MHRERLRSNPLDGNVTQTLWILLPIVQLERNFHRDHTPWGRSHLKLVSTPRPKSAQFQIQLVRQNSCEPAPLLAQHPAIQPALVSDGTATSQSANIKHPPPPAPRFMALTMPVGAERLSPGRVLSALCGRPPATQPRLLASWSK